MHAKRNIKKQSLRRSAHITATATPATPASHGLWSVLVCFGRRTLRSLTNRLAKLRTFAWSHSFFFNVLWGFFVATPPFFVVNFFNNAAFSEEFTKSWPFLAKFFSSDPILWTAAAGLWIPLAERLRKLLSTLLLDEPVSWSDAPQVLLAALDTVVSCKEKRFGEVLQEIKPPPRRRGRPVSGNTPPPPPSAEELFKRITRPEAQIERLISAIYTTFDELTREKGERKMQTLVSLTLVKNGRVEDIPHYLPKSHQLPPDAFERLSQPNSAIMTAIASRRMTVVQSTFDEMEKPNGNYIRIGDASDMSDGALICYPIQLAEDEVAFALSIFYPRRDAFQKRHHGIYEEVLRRFALRLRLEYNLLLLKGLHA